MTVSRKIWVVFSGETDIAWLKCLKQGFRHCFAVLLQRGQWVTLDPMSNQMHLDVQPIDAAFDLPQWLSERGHNVVPVVQQSVPQQVAPFMPFTCVEAVKRLIGLHSWTVITPWQLYKAINDDEKRVE